jgi:hypothetical protein
LTDVLIEPRVTGKNRTRRSSKKLSAGVRTLAAACLAPPVNRSSEELQLRVAATEWGRKRLPGCRVIHELVCGERRADMAIVGEKDLIGIEIKSSRDKLDRLDEQLKEYGRYFPEVWLFIAPKWIGAARKLSGVNVAVVRDGRVEVLRPPKARKPYRDELVTARMLEWLWVEEAARIASRTQVIPGPSVSTRYPTANVRKLLARLLTGNEIIREVCRELRARPLVGLMSDAPCRAQVEGKA